MTKEKKIVATANARYRCNENAMDINQGGGGKAGG